MPQCRYAAIAAPAGGDEGRMPVLIATWNINSVRLRLPLLQRFCELRRPDVLLLQEIKAENGSFPHEAVQKIGFEHNLICGMKSYNGVAILSRVPLRPLEQRAWCQRDDARHAAAVLPDGTEIHNFYVPSGGDIPDPEVNSKFAHKLAFLAEMADWLSARPAGAPMLLGGDLNVAPLETDVWSHKQLLDVVSHTPGEVAALERVRAGLDWVDAVRAFVPPERRLYSWWSYRARDWSKSDRGRRLDHIWITPALRGRLAGAEIMREARGWELPSDHVPVCVELSP